MKSDDMGLGSARMVLYGLFRSFFDSSPSEEKVEYWKSILGALHEGTGFHELDEAVSAMKALLDERDLVQIQNEFYELFENPFSSNRLQLCASYYIDGKLMGMSLVKLRKLLYNLSLGKVDGFTETEDHLVFLLDAMMHLIEQEEQGDDSARKGQVAILEDYLTPCIEGVGRALSQSGNFPFYETAVRMGRAILELEKNLFPQRYSENLQEGQ